MGACVIRGGLKVIVVWDALLSHFISISLSILFTPLSFSRLPSLLLHRCEQTNPLHLPLLSRKCQSNREKNCRRHILNNHRIVSAYFNHRQDTGDAFPQVPSNQETLQRVNKKQQKSPNCEATSATGWPFSVTSASHLKNTMFRASIT